MGKEFDMTKVQRGARLRRTPYFEATQKHGAKGYTVYNHMFFPINFDDLEREYEALLNDEVVSIGAVTAEYLLGQKYAIAAPAKTMEGE